LIERFHETLFAHWGQWFSVEETLFEVRTDHQHLVIFRNGEFGRVMALDGVIQTTERDEFVYHEMLAHTPILAHGKVTRVLIVGGGDGGMLREVLRHPGILHVTQVEIDAAVIEMSRKYLPKHSAGAYDDPRVNIVIDDGLRYVAESDDPGFDVVISDSTDPIGPGEALYTPEFYAGCKRMLNTGGVLVTQNGNAFVQTDEAVATAALTARLFDDAGFYVAPVPTYVGGFMAFGWATDDRDLRYVTVPELERRYQAAGLDTRFYSPAMHRSAFALPRYLEQAVAAVGATTRFER